MTWRLADLAGARVALIGFGREGRATEQVLRQRVPNVEIHVFAESEPSHRPASPATFGPLNVDPAAFDRIIRSPGVPPHHPGLAACVAAGRPMTTSSSIWFAERPDAQTVAVTGSKGKSTTAALLAHLARAGGREVELAGNIGRPLLELLDSTADLFVIELSSYQLADLVGQPGLGAFTRLFPEHADWHGSTQAYYADKLRLVDLLGDHPLWFNAADPVLAEAVGARSNARPTNRPDGLHARDNGLYLGAVSGLQAETRPLFSAEDWALPGRHNLDNLVLAVAVAESLGIDRAAALAAARTFRGLPHRLEPLGCHGGIDWVNDSIATTPFATLAALSADARPTVLIAGGQARSADWDALDGRGFQLRGVVGLPDTGAQLVERLVETGAVEGERAVRVDSLEAAVAAAAALARPGDRVLLSPGAPSFHRYRDFEERGERFRAAVAAWARGQR